MKIKLQKVYITWFIFEPFSIHIHILLFNQIRVNNIITSIAATLCQFQFVMACSLKTSLPTLPKTLPCHKYYQYCISWLTVVSLNCVKPLLSVMLSTCTSNSIKSKMKNFPCECLQEFLASVFVAILCVLSFVCQSTVAYILQ